MRAPTEDVRAYEYYLRGRQYFRQSRCKSLQFAREMFQRATATDPDFALAWAGIADCCSLFDMYYPGNQADVSLADEASARALARAREDYQARFFAAQSYAALGRKAEAEAGYRRALHVVQQHLELNPDDPRAATMCAVSLCRLGRLHEGITWAERARSIDPEDAGVAYNVACLYALEGLEDPALDALQQALNAGFGDREWIAHDPDLESLRGNPRFQSLVGPQTVRAP